ncbi:glycosyltransferase family 9 protein [Azospira oryzae]|uniref:glycosyltransferase family 9 protein n=1 Tax=Azospira oryzae TaxID=146939 RepID=UPI0019653ECC|nr:glycosyltransferase family 9 protein [Azospira oryzae]
MNPSRKILVVRRDNIGDLVCTTPLIDTLRQRFPEAWIGALVNSYNAPVLQGNGALDEVFTYTKLKHRDAGTSALAALGRRLAMIWRLRRMGIDDLILAAPAHQASAERFCRWLKPLRVHRADPGHGGHEVEHIMSALAGLGGAEAGGICRVFPDPLRLERLRQSLPPQWLVAGGPVVGIHISARKPKQRWPIERFAAVMKLLHQQEGARFLLFWAPGAASDPRHPGDDEKAQALLQAAAGLPVAPMATGELADLIAGLSLADRLLCSDGGAMHLAAGLGKPMVCLFGNSDLVRWHPWGVPYEVLQPPSQDVADVTVEAFVAAYARLLARLPACSD